MTSSTTITIPSNNNSHNNSNTNSTKTTNNYPNSCIPTSQNCLRQSPPHVNRIIDSGRRLKVVGNQETTAQNIDSFDMINNTPYYSTTSLCPELENDETSIVLSTLPSYFINRKVSNKSNLSSLNNSHYSSSNINSNNNMCSNNNSTINLCQDDYSINNNTSTTTGNNNENAFILRQSIPDYDFNLESSIIPEILATVTTTTSTAPIITSSNANIITNNTATNNNNNNDAILPAKSPSKSTMNTLFSKLLSSPSSPPKLILKKQSHAQAVTVPPPSSPPHKFLSSPTLETAEVGMTEKQTIAVPLVVPKTEEVASNTIGINTTSTTNSTTGSFLSTAINTAKSRCSPLHNRKSPIKQISSNITTTTYSATTTNITTISNNNNHQSKTSVREKAEPMSVSYSNNNKTKASYMPSPPVSSTSILRKVFSSPESRSTTTNNATASNSNASTAMTLNKDLLHAKSISYDSGLSPRNNMTTVLNNNTSTSAVLNNNLYNEYIQTEFQSELPLPPSLTTDTSMSQEPMSLIVKKSIFPTYKFRSNSNSPVKLKSHIDNHYRDKNINKANVSSNVHATTNTTIANATKTTYTTFNNNDNDNKDILSPTSISLAKESSETDSSPPIMTRERKNTLLTQIYDNTTSTINGLRSLSPLTRNKNNNNNTSSNDNSSTTITTTNNNTSSQQYEFSQSNEMILLHNHNSTKLKNKEKSQSPLRYNHNVNNI